MIAVGRVLLVWRLVIGDVSRRRVQSLLLVVMIVTTTATLALGLALHHVSQSPFARTRAATEGARRRRAERSRAGLEPPVAQPVRPPNSRSGGRGDGRPVPCRVHAAHRPRDQRPRRRRGPRRRTGGGGSAAAHRRPLGELRRRGDRARTGRLTRRPRRRHDFAGRPQVPRRGDRADDGAAVLPGVLARPGVARRAPTRRRSPQPASRSGTRSISSSLGAPPCTPSTRRLRRSLRPPTCRRPSSPGRHYAPLTTG